MYSVTHKIYYFTVTGTLADEPYLIVRDYPDTIHYFFNLCRHHGTLLCDQQKGKISMCKIINHSISFQQLVQEGAHDRFYTLAT